MKNFELKLNRIAITMVVVLTIYVATNLIIYGAVCSSASFTF